MAPIPRRLAEAGVTDMVRLTDGRMSGTSFGTVVLHVAPESAVGGPLGLLQDGDLIELNVPKRTLELLVPPEVLAQRSRAETRRTEHVRGWPRLYQEHVLQAPQGCDLDFLVAPKRDPGFIEPVVGRS